MNKKRIEINNVSFSYHSAPVLKDISLNIEQGEYVAIVGANGSGKTTLLRLISGVITTKTGHIRVAGIDVGQGASEKLVVARNYISVVLQNPEDQFVGTTVREDIAFGLENLCKSRVEMDDVITEVANVLDLHQFLDKEPHQLSGGQKQRVAIASSLAMNTPFLLFDEATSQLDPQGKKEVLEAIQTLRARYEKTMIMVTHDLQEILQADRVIVLFEGQVVADMSPRDLFLSELDLAAYHLQYPPILQYSRMLQQKQLIDGVCLSIRELVDQLCT